MIKNLNIRSRLRKNVIFKIFTKEFKEETKVRENLKNYVSRVKLNSDNYDADEKVKVLIKDNFQSNFKINI